MIFALANKFIKRDKRANLLIDKILACLPRLNENHQMMCLVHKNQVKILSCLLILHSDSLKERTRDKLKCKTHSLRLEISAGNATGRFTISPVHFHSPTPPLMQVPSQMRAAAIRFGEEPHSKSRFTHIELENGSQAIYFSHIKSSFFSRRAALCKKKNQLIFEIICQARVYKVKTFLRCSFAITN